MKTDFTFQAFSLILFLIICPLLGHPRPAPHLAAPIAISVTPLGAAALSTALIGKGILTVGLLKAGAAAVAGGENEEQIFDCK